MAPRHAAEMSDSRHRLRHHHNHDEPSLRFDDEDDPFGTNGAFDPFDESNLHDSFENDLNNFPHEQPEKQPRKQPRSSTRGADRESRKLRSSGRRGSVGTSTTSRSRMNSSSQRLNGSISSRMNDSSTRIGMDDSNSRFMNDDSTSRRQMGESRRGGMGESSRRLGESSRRMGESSRRRRDSRTPKPTHPATFPKNGTRRASSGMRDSSTRNVASKRSSAHGAPPALASMAGDKAATRPPNTRSRSRRSLGESSHGNNNDHSTRRESSLANALRESRQKGSQRDLGMSSSSMHHQPMSPGDRGGSRRSSTSRTAAETKGPSPRSRRGSVTSSLRGALDNSEARSRIRKEAARKQKREQQLEAERKVAKQKAKLARQKERTNELLGRKLARLDVKNGDNTNKRDSMVEDDTKSQGSRGLDASVHRQSQRRSRRRTHLSHNILVRNMNQMTVPRLSETDEELEDAVPEELDHHDHDDAVLPEPFIEDEFDQDDDDDDDDEDRHHNEDDDMTLEADNLQHHSSSASVGSSIDHAKKEAWQRRLERQQRN